MSKTTENNGRLCNQIIRNLALSILAEKYDLYVQYSRYDDINNKLGIKLFIGNKKYNKTVVIKDNNYMNYFNNDIENDANFNFMTNFFQTQEITSILHNHLTTNMKNIIDKNPYKERYKSNNDIFLHIRLTDAKKIMLRVWGKLTTQILMDYYTHCINSIKYDNIYIGSDDFNDEIIKKIKTLYPSVILIKKNPIETIQFGSTCKNIILSHGSFSAVIGFLGFFSNVYFLDKRSGWCPMGMYMNKGFIPISLE